VGGELTKTSKSRTIGTNSTRLKKSWNK